VLGCSHAAAAKPGGRFLYQVSCSAKLDRFDTVTGRRTNAVDLARRTGKRPLIPVVAGALELCLANQVVFDAAAGVFYTLVPSQGTPRDDGTVDYRILGFAIPAITLVKELPGGSHLEHPPRLALGPAGVQAVAPADGPRPDEDLSGYAPEHRALPNRILESSGERLLLQLTAGPDVAIAVADRASRTLVRLQGPLPTVPDGVHLTPGGGQVLVEEARPGAQPARTGTLFLYDARTGARSKTLSDPAVARLVFRGIAPTGRALFDLLEAYRFVDLGMTFPAQPVVRPAHDEFPRPAVFFSDR
jgi:hypothetical protein